MGEVIKRELCLRTLLLRQINRVTNIRLAGWPLYNTMGLLLGLMKATQATTIEIVISYRYCIGLAHHRSMQVMETLAFTCP